MSALRCIWRHIQRPSLEYGAANTRLCIISVMMFASGWHWFSNHNGIIPTYQGPPDTIDVQYVPAFDGSYVDSNSHALRTIDKQISRLSADQTIDDTANRILDYLEDWGNSHYPNTHSIQGSVRVTFTINLRGDIIDANIVDANTPATLLQQAALDMVYAAAPYPIFSATVAKLHATITLTRTFIFDR